LPLLLIECPRKLETRPARLFYPGEKDRLEAAGKGKDILARLGAAEKLKGLYGELRDEIRKNHKEPGFLTKLARDYGMPLKLFFYSVLRKMAFWSP